jgi:deazaflavin-dependent oxidoreductase (nitroreductase family)
MAGWNDQIIEEFRANAGQVGGQFAGAPLALLHHRGRRSGADHVTPVMYLAADDADADDADDADDDPDTVYVFASKGGAPTNPEWYLNLMAAGRGRVEVGTEDYPVAVEEIVGAERDRIYAEQARRYPGFAEYEATVAGARTIPVLALRRRAD